MKGLLDAAKVASLHAHDSFKDLADVLLTGVFATYHVTPHYGAAGVKGLLYTAKDVSLHLA